MTRYIFGITLISGFLVASVFRSIGWFIHDIYWLQQWLGGDKATHFLMGSSSTLAVWLLWRGCWSWQRLVVGAFIAVFILVLDEVSQGFSIRREFELADLVAGCFGIVLALFLATLVMLWQGFEKKSCEK